MADTRGLKVNRDIYNFETRIYGVYDNLPVKHKHTLSELMLKSVLEMRHYTNLACKMYKGNLRQKVEMFGLALGYADDVQDSLDHLYDLGFMSEKLKSSLDMELDIIRVSLSRLVNSFSRELKGAEHREYATCIYTGMRRRTGLTHTSASCATRIHTTCENRPL